MTPVDNRVFCIKVKPVKKGHPYKGKVVLPVKGDKYTIRGFFQYHDSKFISVYLNEIDNSHLKHEPAFPAPWFMYENDIENIKIEELENNDKRRD